MCYLDKFEYVEFYGGIHVFCFTLETPFFTVSVAVQE